MTRGVSAATWGTQPNKASAWQRLQLALRGAMCVVGLALGLAVPPAAHSYAPSPSDFPVISRAELPAQGRAVLARIEKGDSFEHPKDGSVFGNRERLLPKQTRGYYREYTVPTPGLKHRGARRIVCGGKPKRSPDACYYTEDHYASFRLIAQ
jgi:ribonuclease T1